MTEQVFVLTTDSVEGWDCDIIRFPTPIVAKSVGGDASEHAYQQAFGDLRHEAKKLGANVVLGVKTSEPTWFSGLGYVVRAIGTPAYVNPPLPDPDEYLEQLKRSK